MKKLLTMGLVAVAAVAANAAAISWGATQISAGNGITWTGGQTDTYGIGYQAYLFVAESTLAADKTKVISVSDVKTALAKGDFSVLDKSIKDTTTTNPGRILNVAAGTYGVTQADTVKAFMVVFDNADHEKAGYFGISETPLTVNIANGASTNPPANFTGFTAANGWTKIDSVPEPTSGLLLLLGVAGLALRRRRA